MEGGPLTPLSDNSQNFFVRDTSHKQQNINMPEKKKRKNKKKFVKLQFCLLFQLFVYKPGFSEKGHFVSKGQNLLLTGIFHIQSLDSNWTMPIAPINSSK